MADKFRAIGIIYKVNRLSTKATGTWAYTRTRYILGFCLWKWQWTYVWYKVNPNAH